MSKPAVEKSKYLADFLRSLRLDRKKGNGKSMTQNDLAEALGCEKTSIYELEAGRRGLSHELMFKYSDYFGVPESYFEKLNNNSEFVDQIMTGRKYNIAFSSYLRDVVGVSFVHAPNKKSYNVLHNGEVIGVISNKEQDFYFDYLKETSLSILKSLIHASELQKAYEHDNNLQVDDNAEWY